MLATQPRSIHKLKSLVAVVALISTGCLPVSWCVSVAEESSDATLPVKAVPAFDNVNWTGWTPVNEDGKSIDLRPIVLTHANDDSNRMFVAMQRGVVHTIVDQTEEQSSRIFLDISDRVRYNPNENEEGFLGIAFHPEYRSNGEFYVYYTTTDQAHTSVITRRRVHPDDPSRADPEFEEELFRIEQPFWNHNGGNVIFGPDGYLYVSLGDGGAGGDPKFNGQNPRTLFGTILRIDVDGREEGLNYAIPPDNPFANRTDAGRPEVFAYGLRNVWGMSFDKSGRLWAADVGQNKWEEINLITNGGNYGWNDREGFHKFKKGRDRSKVGKIDPIFEYDHEVGKSITGGFVYQGSAVPLLSGAYVYADYVSGKVWALRYDHESKQVLSNQEIQSPKLPIMSFGVDQQQELYFTIPCNDGVGIYRFASDAE